MMKTYKSLLLQKVVYDLPTVAAEVRMDEGDVYPVGAAAGVFPDELVELQVVLDPIEPLLATLQVATDAEVCRLAFRVLRVIHTSYGSVQLFAAESAGYGYRLIHRFAQRFEHITGEIDQCDDLLR